MFRFLRLISAILIASLMMISVKAQGGDGYPEDRPLTIAWTKDGSAVAVGRVNGMIEIYSSSGILQALFEGHSSVVGALSWSPDGSRLASGGWDSRFRIWTPQGKRVFESKLFDYHVETLEWDPRGEYLVVDPADEPVSIWKTDIKKDTYTLVTELEMDGQSSEILWNSKETQIAFTQAYNGFLIYDVVSLKEVAAFGNMNEDLPGDWDPTFPRPWDVLLIVHGAWESHDKALAAAFADGSIMGWDTSGNLLFKVEANSENISPNLYYNVVLEVEFNADGSQLTAVSFDGTIRTWETETFQVVAEAHLPAPVFAAGISPDGTKIAYASVDSTILIKDLSTLLKPIP